MQCTESSCSGDVIRYISRHIDVSYKVLANYNEREEVASWRRFRGRFNLTNTGTTTLRRGHWELYMPSLRGMQFNDNGTMLGNSGLKAGNLLEWSALRTGDVARPCFILIDLYVMFLGVWEQENSGHHRQIFV